MTFVRFIGDTHHSSGKKRLVIHADNYSGQNKNNAMI